MILIRETIFLNEVHSYFGSGTQLQELYITHSLLSKEDWDMLAEAAQWARRNAEVLIDTHWIGGDTRQLQVYGWAAKGTSKSSGSFDWVSPTSHRASWPRSSTATP